VIEAKFTDPAESETSKDERREPTLSRAIHDGLLKVGFDVIRSRVTKRARSSEADRALEGRSHFCVQPRTEGRRRGPAHRGDDGFAINSLIGTSNNSWFWRFCLG